MTVINELFAVRATDDLAFEIRTLKVTCEEMVYLAAGWTIQLITSALPPMNEDGSAARNRKVEPSIHIGIRDSPFAVKIELLVLRGQSGFHAEVPRQCRRENDQRQNEPA